MENLASIYVDDITKTEEFKRLKELKSLIDREYSSLIVAFKNKEALYLEALDRPEVFNLDKAQAELSLAKANLYSKPLVKEYFELERKLNLIMKKDIEELEDSISSHFKKNLL